jgi:REP element-mobilizing transposase RayT
LGQTVTEGQCAVYAWVLMDNHVHLLHTSSRKCIIKNGFIFLWAILAQMNMKRCFQEIKTLSDPVRLL